MILATSDIFIHCCKKNIFNLCCFFFLKETHIVVDFSICLAIATIECETAVTSVHVKLSDI